MKQIFFLCSLLFMCSCNDGDLDIASFEFEETVYDCGENNITLYRLSNDGNKEALILTLTDKEIRQDQEAVAPVRVSENSDYTVTDRIFDSKVTSSYFCSVLPPVTPKVLKNWVGVSGSIYVENKPVYDESGVEITAWEHSIVLQDVVLKSGEESLIFNDTYLFGTFETSI